MSRARLATRLQNLGERVEVGGNKPILLDRPNTIWLIEKGQVELFAISTVGDSPRRHIGTAKAGQMLFGLGAANSHQLFASPTEEEELETGLLAVGFQDSILLKLDIKSLYEVAREEEHLESLSDHIETWVDLLLESITRSAPPKGFVLFEAGGEIHFEEKGGIGRSAEGTVWLRHVSGSSRFLGQEELSMTLDDSLLPLSENTWLVSAEDDVRLSVVETKILVKSGTIWEALSGFHQLFLDLLLLQTEKALGRLRKRLEERAAQDRGAMREAHRQLASTLGDTIDDPQRFSDVDDPLMQACLLVGQAQELEFKAPAKPQGPQQAEAAPEGAGALLYKLQRICATSSLRYRVVLLRDKWWKRDNGPLLALRKDSDEEEPRAVALVPDAPGRYSLVDPVLGTREKVSKKVAASLDGRAFMFYKPLPARALTLFDLARHALKDQGENLRSVLLMGFAGGLLALFVPVITAQLFGTVIPAANQPLLIQMTLALAVAAFAGAAFQVVRAIAMLRISGKLEGALQAAVWDRLLSLPATFFKRYSVGDLSERSMGIERIRTLLTGNVATSFLGAVFSVFSFALLFYYNETLAKLATVLVAILIVVTATTSYLQLRHQRRLLELQGRIASLVLDLITGVSKLRVAGAEHRAYARWADRFSEQRELTIRVRRVANFQAAFNAGYSILTSIIIYGTVIFQAEEILIEQELLISDFLGFMAAYGQFQAAALSLVGVFSSMLTMVPLYERLIPLLAEEPELDQVKTPVKDLRGEIEFSHVSFRYDADGPQILRDVSLRADPGEFIALVGSSGSGKSTSIRLILGFEEAEAGSIFFDGQDLPSLDVQSLRRQIGVVLQHGEPMTGNIFENIVGNNADLTMDDAWRAARMAGLAEDIEAMPMGMHTVISEGGGTFSGGQRQRLLIARAVVNRPRILIFDEATSALDNRTQDLVSRSLEQLKATRIVVAHRLSTIINADRIYVLDKGRVIESGNYQELIELGGLFKELAERQVA